MKKCFKCQIEKPLTEFYGHPQMGDGLLGKCKVCTRKYVAENLAKKMLDPAFRIKEAARHRKKTTDRRNRGLTAIVSKEKKVAYIRKWQSLNPAKRRAHMIVESALEIGKLSKFPCKKCGAINTDAHHEDYSKPLEVIWLCRKHHAERHVEINDAKRLLNH